jgi:ADP-ribose pyrophosphatase
MTTTHGTVHAQRTHDGTLFQVDVLRYTDSDGRQVVREVVRHPGAVVIVPVLDDGSIVMIRNHRIAVEEELLELPAGKLEPAERASPERAAARELEEETGYTCRTLERLGEFYTSPGFANELMHAFVAKGLREARQKLEPGEDIRVEIVAWAKAMELIDAGGVRDGKTIAALLLWSRRRQDRQR